MPRIPGMLERQRPAPPADPIVFCDDVVVEAHVGPVRIGLVTGMFRGVHVLQLEQGLRALAARRGGPVFQLSVVAASAPVGEAAVAREAARILAETRHLVRHQVHVIEGTGAWARTLRTVIRGVMMISGHGEAASLHSRVEEGIEALFVLLADEPGAPRPGELLQVLAEMRRRSDEARRGQEHGVPGAARSRGGEG